MINKKKKLYYCLRFLLAFTVITGVCLSPFTEQVHAAGSTTYTYAGSAGTYTWSKYQPTDSGISSIISKAAALKGIPYKYGGKSKSGFDCSGYVYYVMKNSGVAHVRDLSYRTVSGWKSKYSSWKCYTSATNSTLSSKARKGDVVLYTNASGSYVHMAIYAGSGYVYHSSPSEGVVKRKNSYVCGGSGKGKLHVAAVIHTSAPAGTITITKKTVPAGESLSGFTFNVSCSSLGFSIALTTTSTGSIYIYNLPKAYTFSVSEKVDTDGFATANGFKYKPDAVSRSIKPTGTVVFTNAHQPGELDISKVLEDKGYTGVGPDGFAVRIHRDSFPAYDKTFVTDESGSINVSGLLTGYDYSVEEILTSEQSFLWHPSYNPGTVTIHGGEDVNHTKITNTLKTGKILIEKSSEDGNVSGIRFWIEGPYGITEEVKTGEDGTVSMSDMPCGNYKITEDVPLGYIAQDPKEASVTYNETSEIDFMNELIPTKAVPEPPKPDNPEPPNQPDIPDIPKPPDVPDIPDSPSIKTPIQHVDKVQPQAKLSTDISVQTGDIFPMFIYSYILGGIGVVGLLYMFVTLFRKRRIIPKQ